MNLKSTLARLALALTLISGVTPFTPASAQYCSPTFSQGCALWGSQNISLGFLNWFPTSNCTDSDFTALAVPLTTGVPHYMTVSNGQWCGCAVWIDYNNDYTFDVSENQFYSYVAGTGGVNTYAFYITIPNGTPVGSYRMRVISPWGSDGLTTTNGNGQGPCGSYQNGNFQDFTIVVTGPQGLENVSGNSAPYISASLNSDKTQITVLLGAANPKGATLQLMDVSGRVIETRKVAGEKEFFDVSARAPGIYFVNYFDGEHKQNIKLSK